MSLYSVRQLDVHIYRMVKFDYDFNVQTIYAIYKTKEWGCSCFQHDKPSCRHRQMISLFISENKVNSGWFFDYERKVWERPLNDPVRVMQQRKRREKNDATDL